jgi:hypothetical protein
LIGNPDTERTVDCEVVLGDDVVAERDELVNELEPVDELVELDIGTETTAFASFPIVTG